MLRARRPSDWLALFGLTVMWGSAFMLNELALSAFPPGLIVTGRIVIATALLYAMMRAHGVRLPDSPGSWAPMLAMGIFGNVLPFNLIAWAQQYIDSSLAGVLMAIMPLFVLTLAHFLVPGARMTAYRGIGFGAGFIGVALILGADALRGLNGNTALLGALAVLVAAFSYAVSTIVARRAAVSEPLQLSVGMLLVGSVLSLPIAATELQASIAPTAASVIAVLALGLVSTGYATVLYFRVIQGPGPAFVSLVNFLVPAWAVMVGMLFLGEAVAATTFAGLSLIMFGIAFSEFGPRAMAAIAALKSQRPDLLAGSYAQEET